MLLIIGLGNVGKRYLMTRHNVGFEIVDVLVSRLRFKKFKFVKKLHSLISSSTYPMVTEKSLLLAKPAELMNFSGIAVSKLVHHFNIKLSDTWVIYDDLDIPLGSYKIQKGKGPKDHKGVLSIYEKLKTKDFWHVRIGIDNRFFSEKISGDEYVLQKFTREEREILQGVIDKVINYLVEIIKNSE